MLAKHNRLTKAAFDTYFKTGKRTHSPLVQLVYTPSEHFHGAVVVGKKVSKKAAVRNLLRRRIYGQLYHWHKKNTVTGVFIIILKPAAASATKAEITNAVKEVLSSY